MTSLLNENGIVSRDLIGIVQDQLAIPLVAEAIKFYPSWEPGEYYTDHTDGSKFRTSDLTKPTCALLSNGDVVYVGDLVQTRLFDSGLNIYSIISGFYEMHKEVAYTAINYTINPITRRMLQIEIVHEECTAIRQIYQYITNSMFIHLETTDYDYILSIHRIRSFGFFHMRIPITCFIDDFGRSKKGVWNPVHGVYVCISSIPLNLRNTELCRVFYGCMGRKYGVQEVLSHVFQNEASLNAGFIAWNSNFYKDWFS